MSAYTVRAKSHNMISGTLHLFQKLTVKETHFLCGSVSILCPINKTLYERIITITSQAITKNSEPALNNIKKPEYEKTKSAIFFFLHRLMRCLRGLCTVFETENATTDSFLTI